MDVLTDLVAPGMAVVFCGTAVGHRSAERKAYYAGRGNRFWPVLHAVGLTPRQLEPQEYGELRRWGIGLTDLVKQQHGMDHQLTSAGFDIERLRNQIMTARPTVLAFNGKRAGQTLLGRDAQYGLQPEWVGETAIFVLPSTSGAARAFWDEGPWRELACYVNQAKVTGGATE
jgi:TDG/mug DNA glycosylase family protein